LKVKGLDRRPHRLAALVVQESRPHAALLTTTATETAIPHSYSGSNHGSSGGDARFDTHERRRRPRPEAVARVGNDVMFQTQDLHRGVGETVAANGAQDSRLAVVSPGSGVVCVQLA